VNAIASRKESAGFVKILTAGELLGDSTETREPIASAILDEFEFGPPMFEHGEEQGVLLPNSLNPACPCSANTTARHARPVRGNADRCGWAASLDCQISSLQRMT
jgi:hypothetical protein